jgi:hypothetical protein
VLFRFAALATLLASTAAVAQESLPLPDPRFTGTVGRTYEDSDPAAFPQPVRPPRGAPNVVVILLDEGFASIASTRRRCARRRVRLC